MSRKIQRSIENKFECGTVVGLFIYICVCACVCFVSPIISIQTDYFCQTNENIFKNMNFVGIRKLVNIIE